MTSVLTGLMEVARRLRAFQRGHRRVPLGLFLWLGAVRVGRPEDIVSSHAVSAPCHVPNVSQQAADLRHQAFRRLSAQRRCIHATSG